MVKPSYSECLRQYVEHRTEAQDCKCLVLRLDGWKPFRFYKNTTIDCFTIFYNKVCSSNLEIKEIKKLLFIVDNA